MMLGGGCGKELAHWIVHGRPEKDMYGYDIRKHSSGSSPWLVVAPLAPPGHAHLLRTLDQHKEWPVDRCHSTRGHFIGDP
uniref:Uncharacterized protein n=1 Tax=Sphaerodactylus townsendi TaxID=933632 RepID=A0ACB8EZZ2_9SAUR